MTSGAPTRMAAWLESAWLARYLERQLDGEELAWFEAYLLDKPELLGMVEADNALRDGLGAESWLPKTTDAQEFLTNPVGLSSETARPIRQVPLWSAIAVSLVLGVGVGAIGIKSSLRASSNGEWIPNPTRAVFDTMRGSEQESVNVEHAASASPYILIEIAVPPNAADVVLEFDQDQHARLAPSADGFVSFLVARSVIENSTIATIRYVLAGESRSRTVPLDQLTKEHAK